MEGTPRFYDTLVQVLSPHQNGVDRRQLKTLAWRLVGLRESGQISLTAGVPSVHSRAVYAQSRVRRVARGREHDRIDVHALYGPLMQQALAEWGHQLLSLALDTSTLGNTYGRVRMSSVYRGRAVSIVWKVLDHPSSRVAYDVYKAVLEKVAELLPWRWNVVLTANRGFADTHLMAHLARLRWHWRSRINGSCWMYRQGQRRCQVHRMPWCAGKALCWPHVSMTTNRDGPVPLALSRPTDSPEYWFGVSDEPTEWKTFAESGLRCDSEANF
jgi:hypothetical protein